MSIDLRSTALPLPTDGVLTASSSETPGRGQIQALSQEFESLLLLQIMRQVRQTLTSFGDDATDPDGSENDLGPLTDTVDDQLAQYLSQAGGLGLSSFLTRALSKSKTLQGRLGPQPPPDGAVSKVVSGPAAPALEAPGDAATPRVVAVGSASTDRDDDEPESEPAPLVLEGVVTSGFGWRSDPFQHTPKFHGGVDIQAAYGREVPAAGSGRVTVAQAQGEYGLTVVVAHPNGLETRYAHLSSLAVSEGQQVNEGQTIGRVGQTGRATGPHLHFEVMRDGRRVDPANLVQGIQALKRSPVRADLTSSSSSRPDPLTTE